MSQNDCPYEREQDALATLESNAREHLKNNNDPAFNRNCAGTIDLAERLYTSPKGIGKSFAACLAEAEACVVATNEWKNGKMAKAAKRKVEHLRSTLRG